MLVPLDKEERCVEVPLLLLLLLLLRLDCAAPMLGIKWKEKKKVRKKLETGSACIHVKVITDNELRRGVFADGSKMKKAVTHRFLPFLFCPFTALDRHVPENLFL